MSFVTGNPDIDFFEQNPELKYITDFKLLIEKEGKKTASRIMWCIYMIEDPKSRLFRMPRKEKISEVKSNYFSEFDEDKYSDLSRSYSTKSLEKEEYLYNIHVEKLDDLTAHLQKLQVEKDIDFAKYIKIVDKLPRIWDALEKVKSKMIDKQNKTNVRGNAQQSAREKRNSR